MWINPILRWDIRVVNVCYCVCMCVFETVSTIFDLIYLLLFYISSINPEGITPDGSSVAHLVWPLSDPGLPSGAFVTAIIGFHAPHSLSLSLSALMSLRRWAWIGWMWGSEGIRGDLGDRRVFCYSTALDTVDVELSSAPRCTRSQKEQRNLYPLKSIAFEMKFAFFHIIP